VKKILYIVNGSHQDWELITPTREIESTYLVVKDEFDSENIPLSQKYILNQGNDNKGSASNTISYQKFLEEIFSSDLPMVL